MPFRFDKLTVKAQEAVQQAQELASSAGNPQIEAALGTRILRWQPEQAQSPILKKCRVSKNDG